MGTFRYDADYRQCAGALALDPMNLPFTRSTRPARETRQGGIFGVFRDASPEGYGLAVLERRLGRVLPDSLERLEYALGDAVGALEVCDDIASKVAFLATSSDDLLDALARLPADRLAGEATRELLGLGGTSLGGERPKMTVIHKGQMWIAKLQDRGDRPHSPLREYLAMRLAARCGIDAHLRGDRQRSYLAFAHEARRWCGSRATDPGRIMREIWRRLAFNAICGNGDDHPRNHGLLHRDGHWALAPAFDIAPHGTSTTTLAMAVNREGSTLVDRETILGGSASFGYPRDEAQTFLERAAETVAAQWSVELRACGLAEDALPPPDLRWVLPRLRR